MPAKKKLAKSRAKAKVKPRAKAKPRAKTRPKAKAKPVKEKPARARATPKPKAKAKPRGTAKAKAKPKPRSPRSRPQETFVEALAGLLRSRKIAVPRGLASAPAEAYAHQPASFVENLAGLGNDELAAHAEKVATWAARQAERARTAWETSPLIAEIRRRGLHEPDPPSRVVAIAYSLKKPLAEWTDRELIQAAAEWARRGT